MNIYFAIYVAIALLTAFVFLWQVWRVESHTPPPHNYGQHAPGIIVWSLAWPLAWIVVMGFYLVSQVE